MDSDIRVLPKSLKHGQGQNQDRVPRWKVGGTGEEWDMESRPALMENFSDPRRGALCLLAGVVMPRTGGAVE